MDDNTALTVRYAIFTVLVVAVMVLFPSCNVVSGLFTFAAGILFPTSHATAFLKAALGNQSG